MSLRQQRGFIKRNNGRIEDFIRIFDAQSPTLEDLPDFHAKLSQLLENKNKLSALHDQILLEENVNKDEEESTFIDMIEKMEDAEDQLRKLIWLASNSVPSTSNQSSSSTSAYEETQQKIVEILDKLASNQGGGSSRFKLQPLSIPKFSGDYKEWNNFKDMFTTLVHEDKHYTKMQKLHCLLIYTDGEAKALIEHLKISDDHYDVAWNLLQKRYDDRYAIVKDYLVKFLNQPVITSADAANIRKMHGTSVGILHSIDAMNVTGRDTWIIHLLLEKLDHESQVLWSREPKSEIPTWDEFEKFLSQRYKSLEFCNPPSARSVPSSASQLNQTTHTSNATKKQPFNKAQKYNSRATTSALISAATPFNCKYCNKSNHKLNRCYAFLRQSSSEKLDIVNQLNLCRNCLSEGHSVSQCTSSSCKECNGDHNSILHEAFSKVSEGTTSKKQMNISRTQRDNSTVSSSRPQVTDNSKKDETINATVAISSTAQSSETLIPRVFLATAVVKILDEENRQHLCRVVLDGGAQTNLITTDLCQRLSLKKKSSDISILGVNNAQISGKHHVDVTILSRLNDSHFNLQCYVIPRVTGNLPNWNVDTTSITLPDFKPLADPQWNIQQPVDMLIGGQYYWDIIGNETIKLGAGLPQLKSTAFGWIIVGPHNQDKPTETVQCNLTTLSSIDATLKKFWEVEELSQKPATSKEQQEAEEFFVETTTRTSEGRYCVRLPFRHNAIHLENNRDNALRQFLRLERRFSKDPELANQYHAALQEYLDLNFMEEVPTHELDNKAYYMPHHPVIREDSATTRVRVVYNASSKSSSGLSLNDVLKIGAPVQQDLFSILLQFRHHEIAFSCDIVKMYPQTRLHASDSNYQRILYRKSTNEPITDYRMITVCFGVSASPFLATRALNQLAHDEGDKYPIAATVILNNFYVDDCLYSCPSIEDAIIAKQQLIDITSTAKLSLAKWHSNQLELLDAPQQSTTSTSKVSMKIPDTAIKALGMRWNQQEDDFQYGLIEDVDTKDVKKRSIFSIIAKIYDPLGLVGPVVIQGKILLQELWKIKIDWDDIIPPDIRDKWNHFVSSLQEICFIRIPRCISSASSPDNEELHVFCDSSQQAYGAAVYLVSLDAQGVKSSHLVAAKSRVAPLGTITIPRLELCAAVLGVRLINKVKSALKTTDCHYWTDSTIVLGQIKSIGQKLDVFVSHRIAEIQQYSSSELWRHVPSQLNPADIISRGCTPSQLNEFWFHGPQFLLEEESTWPILPQTAVVSDNGQLLITPVPPDPKIPSNIFTKVLNISSDYSEIKRILAICIRFLRIKQTDSINPHSGSLVVSELLNVERLLIKYVQGQHFGEVFNLIKNKRIGSDKNWKHLRLLTPFIDEEGIIRVGGRLANSGQPYDVCHPILLPKGEFSRMLAVAEHKRLLHPGPQQLLSSLRQRFWPLGGRNLAKKVYADCIKCARINPKPLTQIMSDLPSQRVQMLHPFTSTGVDYAGPVLVRPDLRRGGAAKKSYIAVFVCLSTKALHLELVSDLTTEGFIAALHRFIARRSAPSEIFSDNGTNFIGAERELREFLQSTDTQTQIVDAATSSNIKWHFSPSHAPHHGGLWEAAVKSMKHHLRRIVGNTVLTFEKMTTVLTQIEAVLNSRPITPLSDDPSEGCLTPGHFLVGRPVTELPNPDLSDINQGRLNKWQLCQRLQADFTKKWKLDYLHTLQKRTKWHEAQQNLKIGDIVVVCDSTPSHQWPLGRIVDIHPGRDGHVRVVSVATKGGVYTRSITQLSILPLE